MDLSFKQTQALQPTFYKPHPALSGIVNHIMIFEMRFAADQLLACPFPPTPQNSIHFYPRDKTEVQPNNLVGFTNQPDSIVVGPQVSKVNLKLGRHHIIVSVAFEPGGLFRLLKIPLYELYDRSFDTTLFLGREIREVNERLREAETHFEMKNVVEGFLLRKINPKPITPIEMAMKKLLASNGTISMENAASFACLSLRQFERKSKDLLGYSPKFFARLIRFSGAYRLKESNQNLSWTAIAHASGYFDQMHMIKDFKEFTGTTPSFIAREINDAPFRLQEKMLF